MDILNLIMIIMIGASMCVLLAIQLIKYIIKSIKEKDFGKIMDLILDLMPEAEERFSTGAEKKEYVMNNIKSLSSTLGYNVDMDMVGQTIDALVALTKKVNK